MTLPEHYDLTIEQGASLKRWWRLQYKDGTVVDLSAVGGGYTIGRLTVMDKYPADGGVHLFPPLTTTNGGVVISYQADADGAYWTGAIVMSAAATAALVPWGEAVYDLEISNGSDVIRVLQGICTLSPEAST